jgi:TolA-binding protein
LISGQASFAGQQPQSTSPSAAPSPQTPLPDEGNIPEEDETEHHETEYHFNPIRARKEFDAGMFYFKKGSYRAAAGRFREASRWNPQWTEAFMKLGESEAKLHHKDEAQKAFTTVAQMQPGSKEGKEARKMLEKLGSGSGG